MSDSELISDHSILFDDYSNDVLFYLTSFSVRIDANSDPALVIADLKKLIKHIKKNNII